MPVERVARCVDGESGTATRSSAVRASPVPRSLLEGSRGSQTRKSRCLASDRGAAGRESGGWRRTRGRGSSLERPDDPGEISARNETPRRTFRGQGAAERGGAGALREGGRHGDARRWMCARTSVKKRDGRRLSFADPSSGRKGTCRCETSGARATGLTRVRRQELWRSGGRLLWRRRLMSLVARSEEGPLKFDIWTVGAAIFPRNRRLGLKDRGL